MQQNSPQLFIEISNLEIVFIVGKNNEKYEFELIYSNNIKVNDAREKEIFDFESIHNLVKENIYLIEQKLNFTFKEVTLIIDMPDNFLINFTGFKKLNGSQLTKQNVTFIINSLKSKIDEFENNKKIIHIFNSEYLLDKKKVGNLPIGLFGDFYSHELTFFLIDKNDFKNLENIFSRCNLRIKKLISKSFLNGIHLINGNLSLNTFFKVEINRKTSKLIFFDNHTLKFIQDFKFGTDLIFRDISKITKLNLNVVEKILNHPKFLKNNIKEPFLDKELFENNNFRKIHKKLIFDIAEARIQEFAEIFLYKNINLKNFLKKKSSIFLGINDYQKIKCFEESFLTYFSNKKGFEVNLIDKLPLEEACDNINSFVQFGWKSEAVPFIPEKKSLIARFFDLFN
tara:strand:+ start:4950 stop:6143 length:1194 start_codon:yes stop_codon:yes gene_type:complete